MPTLAEVMHFVRTRYHSQYAEYSDAELAEMIQENYDLDDEPTSLAIRPYTGLQLSSSNGPSAYPDRELSKQLREIHEYYQPNKGRFRMWLDEIRSNRRAKHVREMNSEMMALIERGKMLEDQAISSRRKREELNTFIAENQFHLFKLMKYAERITRAVSEGVSVNGLEEANLYRMKTNDDIRMEQELARIKQNQEDADHSRRLEKEEAEHRRDLEKREKIAKIELDNEIQLAQEEIRLAIIADNLTWQQQMILIQELIDNEYIKIAEVEANPKIPASAKKKIIESRERMIEMFMEQQSETQNKLLSKNNGT